MIIQANNQPVQTATKPILTLTKNPDVFTGYINHYRQPMVLLNLRIQPILPCQFAPLQQVLDHYLQKYQVSISLQSPEDVVNCFANVICILQKFCGLPIFEPARIQQDAQLKNEFRVWIPMLFEICFHPIAAFVMKLFNYHLQQDSFLASEKLIEELNILIANIKMHAPKGSNTLRFLQAAFEEKIPWRHIAHNTFQYGYGKHSCWLDSSFTDKTPHISTSFVENKNTVATVLAQAGFPLAEQYIARSELDAVTLANKLRYPVVIKPLDGHGGMDVYVNLLSAESVKKAFYAIKKNNRTVLVEKHIIGKDYRIVVLNGKMIWAIERIPAAITGNGCESIQTLIEQHNQCYEFQFPLRHIKITPDTIDYLTEQGFTLTTIPQNGQVVTLNRIANVSAGGTPVGVFEKVHPDNQTLAEAAAKLLRLDLVGIDFIMPDIQKSYRETGGKIIEVNVQPQLGITTAPHIYKQILATLIPNQGRIPIFVIYGSKATHQDYILKLKNKLLKQYNKVGLAKDNSVIVNNKKILDAPSLFAAGQHLLLMNDLDVLIYHINDYSDVKIHGLPFEYYDHLILKEEDNNEYIRDDFQTTWL